MTFRPHCMATTLSALPHRDPVKACEVILENFPEAPVVPRLTMSTRMFLEGMPCLVIDTEKRQLFLDLAKEQELLEFYECYETGEINRFSISQKWAPDLYIFADILAHLAPPQLQLIHLNVPGPFTFGLGIIGGQGVPAWYDETMRDIVVKTLRMKIMWASKFLKEAIPGKIFMVTLSEPSLATYGSPFGSFIRQDILTSIDEVLNAVEGVRSVHCCANIDWSILTDSSTQVINFDAFRFSESIALYAKDIKNFLEREGMLAWGIVPADNETIIGEDIRSLMARLEAGMKLLANEGIDRQLVFESSFVTTSCTTSLMSVEMAERAFRLTAGLSERMRDKYFSDT